MNHDLLAAQSEAMGISIIHGEFHTFVTDGPLFKNRIRIGESEKILEDGYWRLDILDYAVEQKK
ncbi:MAG: hypothetical protein IBX41_04370 [Methanophagales archaeon]|nr:hypothetical protein [Methanophagales archaeon]